MFLFQQENTYYQLQNRVSSYQPQKAECGKCPTPCPSVSAFPGLQDCYLRQENLFETERNPSFQLCKDTHTFWEKNRRYHNNTWFFFLVIGFGNHNWFRVNWSGCEFCVLKGLERAQGLEARCPGAETEQGQCHGYSYSLDTPSCLFLFNGCHYRLNCQQAPQHGQDTVTWLFPNDDLVSPHTPLSLESGCGPWVPLSSSTATRTAEDACVLSITYSRACEPHFSCRMLCIRCMEVHKRNGINRQIFCNMNGLFWSSD